MTLTATHSGTFEVPNDPDMKGRYSVVTHQMSISSSASAQRLFLTILTVNQVNIQTSHWLWISSKKETPSDQTPLFFPSNRLLGCLFLITNRDLSVSNCRQGRSFDQITNGHQNKSTLQGGPIKTG